jgi:isopentenyl diphosphate isomerase/L-lactate dehydrogenase-like FMN-dependent dehydrogenase
MSPSRRAFLRFLAGSPLLSLAGLPACTSRDAVAGQVADRTGGSGELGDLITAPDEALNVFDFAAVAEANLPPAHWGYMATGVDDDLQLQVNREGFQRFHLRPRRLVDVSDPATGVQLLGERWETPIVICPCGSQGAFHEDGELATARAARSRGHLMMLSNVSSTAVEDVIAARGAPVWQQLYPTDSWAVAEGVVQRAEAAGCPVVVLTVDLQPGGNRETLERYIRTDSRDCARCHTGQRKPMYEGLDLTGADEAPTTLTWDFVERLRAATSMRVLVKGIGTAEDARLCVESGIDGVVVSNHGGRADDFGLSTVEMLPEMVEAVGGRIPVIVDGGFRRGTDILKAMALGATAVGIGRPYLWGLGAFGQAGVEAVLDLLRAELVLAMQQAGIPSLGEIPTAAIGKRS